MDRLNKTISDEEFYKDDLLEDIQENINRLMSLSHENLSHLYKELELEEIPKNIIDTLIRYVITLIAGGTLKFVGSLEQRTYGILKAIRQQNPWITFVLNVYSIPTNQINQILKEIILYTLENI